MMSLFVSLGFDCDVPRGINFVNSPKGRKKLDKAISGLEFITDELERLQMPRTHFICGEFLESFIHNIGLKRTAELFKSESDLTEIGNHTWSHSVVSKIPTRPDKIPLKPNETFDELRKTNDYLCQMLGISSVNGFRSPLGHSYGLKNSPEVLEVIKKSGFKYVSSDLRCSRGGIEPPLLNEDSSPRQPYVYFNGLIEVPSHGWHDTAFNGKSKTPFFNHPPTTYDEILRYYNDLIKMAGHLSTETGLFCLTLVFHPIEIHQYAEPDFFENMMQIVNNHNGRFISYEKASCHCRQ
jgi:peptidoglycan/xylan/chitin deacetylase (PgdA/CDA1 family)